MELKPPHEGWVLIDECQEEYEDWFFMNLDRGCTCFTGCAPCSWCTHPGNPIGLNECYECWKDGNELRAAVRRVVESNND